MVLDGFFQHNPTARGVERFEGPLKGFETLDLNVLDARPHRWRFNLVTGQTKEESMSDRSMEFGMINGSHGGRKHRYSYNAVGAPGLFAFRSLVKHDLDTGAEEELHFDDGVYVSETVMAPRDGSTAEDDGYLVTFSSDVINDRSQCLVFDAAALEQGPVAKITLPERICSGTHATWASASRLPSA